jgi:hypothetical protein
MLGLCEDRSLICRFPQYHSVDTACKASILSFSALTVRFLLAIFNFSFLNFALIPNCSVSFFSLLCIAFLEFLSYLYEWLAHLDQKQLGRTALTYAVLGGHTDCARLLIDSGADKEVKDDVRGIRDSSLSFIITANVGSFF